MAIQTEFTLQPDYTCYMRVMGEYPALQKLPFYHFPSILDQIMLNPSYVYFYPQGGVTIVICNVTVDYTRLYSLPMLLNYCYKSFFNILTNHYRVCE